MSPLFFRRKSGGAEPSRRADQRQSARQSAGQWARQPPQQRQHVRRTPRQRQQQHRHRPGRWGHCSPSNTFVALCSSNPEIRFPSTIKTMMTSINRHKWQRQVHAVYEHNKILNVAKTIQIVQFQLFVQSEMLKGANPNTGENTPIQLGKSHSSSFFSQRHKSSILHSAPVFTNKRVCVHREIFSVRFSARTPKSFVGHNYTQTNFQEKEQLTALPVDFWFFHNSIFNLTKT